MHHETEALQAAISNHVGRTTRKVVGLSVGVLAGGNEVGVGFGRTGIDDVVPDERTSYQIGSITKVFTSLLLAVAVERGEVGLEQPLSTIFPEAATHPKGRPITLLDLATHRSGLGRLPPGFMKEAKRHKDDPYAWMGEEELLAAVAQTPPRPPGVKWAYSNYGGGLLGQALATVAGAPFEELIQTRITEPLGMEDTVVSAADATGPLARGHTRGGKVAADWNLAALAGAGALRSTVEDLLTFLRAHLEPAATPLEQPLRQTMRQQGEGPARIGMGLGWLIMRPKRDPEYLFHNGGTGGFRSAIALDPAAGVGVVLLANSARSVDRSTVKLLQHLAAS